MSLRAVFAVGLFLVVVSGCDVSKPPPQGVDSAKTATPVAPPAPASPKAPEPAKAAPAPGAGVSVSAGSPAAGLVAPGQPGGVSAAPPAAVGAPVKTPSGLEYTVLKEGVGATPALGAKVKVHVIGTRASDGGVFMDTRKAGVPKEYKLDSLELIKGWVETLQTMRTGERRKVHVPNALAYGVRGLPEVVPPRTDVDFDIELVSFTPPGVK